LDASKRSRLRTHYTDRENIVLIVERVAIRPWSIAGARTKAEIATQSQAAEAVKTCNARNRRLGQAETLLARSLHRPRSSTVPDPACGSGNFLCVSIRRLKDFAHRGQLGAGAPGLPVSS
jgi:hypothetical protein